jgi:hypothetical protein
MQGSPQILAAKSHDKSTEFDEAGGATSGYPIRRVPAARGDFAQPATRPAG